MAGLIFSKERKLEKAGQQVQPDIALDVRARTIPGPSRGGLKLARAIDEFNIDPTDKICIDGRCINGRLHRRSYSEWCHQSLCR